jgi:hypothetical protein
MFPILYVPCKRHSDVYVASHIIKKFTLTVAKFCGQIIIFAFQSQVLSFIMQIMQKNRLKKIYLYSNLTYLVVFRFASAISQLTASKSAVQLAADVTTSQWAKHAEHTFGNLAFFASFSEDFTSIGPFLL